MNRSNRTCALSTLAAVALGLFCWLARAVSRGAMDAWDAQVRARVHAHASSGLTTLMLVFTQLGEVRVLAPLCLGVTILLVRARRRHAALLFAVAAAGGEAWDQLLKAVFQRPRPAGFFGITSPDNYSFPSGHALMSVVIFGMLAAMLMARVHRRLLRIAVWAAATVLVVLIGGSRIYLGVHWPTDVLGGYLAGLAWLLLLVSLAGPGMDRPSP